MVVKLLRSAFIGFCLATLLLWLLPTLRTVPISAPVTLISEEETPVSYNQAVRRAAPAVVNVYNNTLSLDRSNKLEVRNLGSGVIMNDRGYILTNRHVINNADQIIITLLDGRSFEAMLVGSDTLTDLAVLKIQANNLPVIPINPKRESHVGDVVLAIGNPYNLGQTITQGIISATGRIGLSQYGRQNFLQTDASINHGNSGGALVNTLGELVGINSLSLNKSEDGETPEGIGFAIPTVLANKVMEKLIRDGRVIRGYIGLEAIEPPPARILSTPNVERLPGVVIKGVTPDGPADKAGIQSGDILLSVNNIPTNSVLETMDQVAEIRPGTEIPVEILRRGKKIIIKVTITESMIN